MVVVPQEAGWPGGPLADGPLHDGVSAVREGWAVLPDGTVDEAQVLQQRNILLHSSTVPQLHSSTAP